MGDLCRDGISIHFDELVGANDRGARWGLDSAGAADEKKSGEEDCRAQKGGFHDSYHN